MNGTYSKRSTSLDAGLGLTTEDRGYAHSLGPWTAIKRWPTEGYYVIDKNEETICVLHHIGDSEPVDYKNAANNAPVLANAFEMFMLLKKIACSESMDIYFVKRRRAIALIEHIEAQQKG